MAYEGMRQTQGGHLGGNIVEGDPLTFAPTVWNYLIERFALTSVLDLGCGIANAADYFSRKGVRAIAVDGMPDNIARAVHPAIRIDLTQQAVECRVDLVHCQELVEHIEEQFIDNLLRSLACGKFIVMTHALPGQGGYHHVNEKPTQYWLEQLARVNCFALQEDTNRVRKFAAEDGATYLAATGIVLANRSR